jgi:glycosyltransferase involved in cell wall biosynthesis
MSPSSRDGPLFSVVVPTHDRPGLLSEALASVMAQTVRDFECLVVDDGGSVDIELPQDHRFQLVRREANEGPGAARNTALAVARGSFVTFIDDDDLVLPDRLKLALRGLKRAPVTLCRRSEVGGKPSRDRTLEGDVYHSILDTLTPHLGQVALPLRDVPPFDPRFKAVEDVDWWLRLAKGRALGTVQEVGYLVRRHAGIRNLHGTEARVRGSLLLLEVHRDYFAQHPSAAAFRWKRIGILALATGDAALARRAFRVSFRLRPSPRTLWHMRTAWNRDIRPSERREGGETPERRATCAS